MTQAAREIARDLHTFFKLKLVIVDRFEQKSAVYGIKQ